MFSIVFYSKTIEKQKTLSEWVNPKTPRPKNWQIAFSYRLDSNYKRSLETYFFEYKVTRYRSCASDRDFKTEDGKDFLFLVSNFSSQALAPSSWSMLVYNEATSMVTRIVSSASLFFLISSSFFRKCFVSRTKDVHRCAWRFRNESRNSESLLVQEFTCDTIGRRGGKLVNTLWILGSP